MKSAASILSALLCLWAFVLGGALAFGASPRGLNNAGVAAYEQGDYATALERFQEAKRIRPEDPRLDYNLGAARAAQEEYDEALPDLARAVQAREAAVRDRARFAEGTIYYRRARERAQQGDSQGALEAVKASLEANRSVLLSDPGDADARTNFELADRLRKEIEKQLEQQKKQQNQDDKKEDQDKSEENEQERQDQKKEEEQDSQEKQEQENDENRQGGEPEPTPTPQPGQEEERQDESGEHDESDKAEEKPSAPREEQRTAQTDNGQDAAASLLNLLEDNDVEAMKRMLKLRYGQLPQPEKDW